LSSKPLINGRRQFFFSRIWAKCKVGFVLGFREVQGLGFGWEGNFKGALLGIFQELWIGDTQLLELSLMDTYVHLLYLG
jgi:hypothetical protein